MEKHQCHTNELITSAVYILDSTLTLKHLHWIRITQDIINDSLASFSDGKRSYWNDHPQGCLVQHWYYNIISLGFKALLIYNSIWWSMRERLRLQEIQLGSSEAVRKEPKGWSMVVPGQWPGCEPAVRKLSGTGGLLLVLWVGGVFDSCRDELEETIASFVACS